MVSYKCKNFEICKNMVERSYHMEKLPTCYPCRIESMKKASKVRKNKEEISVEEWHQRFMNNK